MEARLTGIDRRQVLLYLGYRGIGLTEQLEGDIADCTRRMLEIARPRCVWRIFPWDPEAPLAGTDFTPAGQDIRDLLRESRQVILFAATLGVEAERLIRVTERRDMGRALILDCCGSAAIENVCDNLCRDLANQYGFTTNRFSPGYGDFPFAQQPEFCRVLNVERTIGVTLTPGGLMVPQKSVTALLGVADRPQPRRNPGCGGCARFDTCNLRKEGGSCGKVQ